uniref:Uncharacterized protein n=1 Tax=Rhizophora mucronata TaxID=61149 RepID=A0A2P2J3B1_RHIMU
MIAQTVGILGCLRGLPFNWLWIIFLANDLYEYLIIL